jgi:hypothetical protein
MFISAASRKAEKNRAYKERRRERRGDAVTRAQLYDEMKSMWKEEKEKKRELREKLEEMRGERDKLSKDLERVRKERDELRSR